MVGENEKGGATLHRPAPGKLFGVGVGPGDPELLTLRAARILREVDCIAAPDVGSSMRTALRIAQPYVRDKPVLDCTTPMSADSRVTARAYDAIADAIRERLDAGMSVAFITLGDPSIYSTWSYVCERMEGGGYEIEVVPGVPSFCAVAAALRQPLCERQEQLLVVPVSQGDPHAALAVPGTKVFMKAGKRLGNLRDVLVREGRAADASLVANCGLDGQRVLRGLPADGEMPGYLSVVVVKDVPACDPVVAAPDDCPPTAHAALRDVAAGIPLPSDAARRQAVEHWNAVAKPIGSLGVLEDDVARIAALTGSADVELGKRAVAVFCADNGVVAEGVSQCGREVTAAVAAQLARGLSSVCKMASTMRVDPFAIDMGMAQPQCVSGLIDRRVAAGTGNIARGPAMTRDQALQAIRAGMDLAAQLKGEGYDIVASGEMGIGDTTTASAMAAVFLGLPVEQVVGRGAGLSDEGLARKRDAVRRAIAVNRPDGADALDVLAKLGGFEIAGMAGLFIGGSLHRLPVIVDGFISAVAAFTACRLVPACAPALLASHASAEPAARLVLARLGLHPPIKAGMYLGEGAGAVCLIPLLDAALALYAGTTFQQAGIDAYDPALAGAGCGKGRR